MDNKIKRWDDFYNKYKNTTNYNIDKEMLDYLAEKIEKIIKHINSK